MSVPLGPELAIKGKTIPITNLLSQLAEETSEIPTGGNISATTIKYNGASDNP